MSEEKKFDQIKYNNQYKRDHYYEMRVLVPKDQNIRERIKAHADREGLSMSQWIFNVIMKELQRGE